MSGVPPLDLEYCLSRPSFWRVAQPSILNFRCRILHVFCEGCGFSALVLLTDGILKSLFRDCRMLVGHRQLFFDANSTHALRHYLPNKIQNSICGGL